MRTIKNGPRQGQNSTTIIMIMLTVMISTKGPACHSGSLPQQCYVQVFCFYTISILTLIIVTTTDDTACQSGIFVLARCAQWQLNVSHASLCWGKLVPILLIRRSRLVHLHSRLCLECSTSPPTLPAPLHPGAPVQPQAPQPLEYQHLWGR